MKRSFALVLVLAVLLPVLAMSVMADDGTTPVYYMSGKKATGYASVYVDDLAKGDVVKSIKSSNKAVAKYTGITYHTGEYETTSLNWETEQEETEKGSDYSASIQLALKKAGTAKISYKVGTKAYSTKIVVKKYANPVKSLKISGVNGGKNIASKFKSQCWLTGVKSTKASSGKIQVKAASGWAIRSINYSKTGYGDKHITYTTPVSSASLNMGSVAAKQNATVIIVFENKSTHGRINVEVYTGKGADVTSIYD